MVKPLPSHHAVERVDAPLTTPITLSEVKSQLRVESSDDDIILARLINVAIAYTDVRGALGQAMITQKWGQWLAPNPPQRVDIMLKPLQSVTAIKYYDENGDLQSDDINNYEVYGTENAASIGPKDNFSWPTTQNRNDAIKIEYEIGYGDAASDVPDTIRHAMMLLIGHWYDNREQTQMDELSNIPFGFVELMNMHRENWYG